MSETERRSPEQSDTAGNGHPFDGAFGALDGGDLRETLREAEPRVREMLARHPVPLLLGALAAGYLIARLMRGDDS